MENSDQASDPEEIIISRGTGFYITDADAAACRELMVQLMPDSYKNIEIMLDYENNGAVPLGEITPERWI